MQAMEFNICKCSKNLLAEYLRPCSAFTTEDIIEVQDTKILWDSIKKDKQQKTHSIENF
jgi:hypothetical protein